MTDASVLRGVVRGKTIELDQQPGLPDRQPVTVIVQPVAEKEPLAPGEGIRRSAGAWADDPAGVDDYREWNRRQRKSAGPRMSRQL